MALLWLLPLYAFALVAPLSVAGGNVGTGLILTLTAGALLLHADRRALLPRRLLVALATVLAWNALSCAVAAGGDRQWFKLGEEWWMKLLLPAVPVLAAASWRHIRWIVAVLLATGAVSATYGILQHFTGQDLMRHRELLRTGGSYLAVGFTGHHLSFGGQLMFLLAMAGGVTAAMWSRSRPWSWRVLAAGAVLLLTGALLSTYARSALLGAAAAAACVALVQTGLMRKVGLALLVAGALAVILTPSLRSRMAETFTDPKESTRLNLWRSSVAGISARPLAGWGPGNFDRMLKAHEVPGYYEARGHAHNDFLMQAVNAGIPGLLLFLWLHGELALFLARALRVRGDASGLITGGLACQAAAAVGGMFQVFQTDDEPEMLLYFLLGCALAAALGAQASAGPEADGKSG